MAQTNQKPDEHCTGVTQEGELNVSVVLSTFIRTWVTFRCNPTHSRYRATKDAFKEVERVLDAEWRDRPLGR